MVSYRGAFPVAFGQATSQTYKQNRTTQQAPLHNPIHFGLQNGQDQLSLSEPQQHMLAKLGEVLEPVKPNIIQKLDETGQTPEAIRNDLTQAGFNLLSVQTPNNPQHIDNYSPILGGMFTKLPADILREAVQTSRGERPLPHEVLAPHSKQTPITNQTLVAIEMAKKSVGIATAIGVNNGLALEAINQIATPEQKAFWLPLLANGTLTYGFGLTEKNHGSDPRSMETTYEKFEEGGKTFYRLNGDKKFIGNAAQVLDADENVSHRGADFIVVFAVNKTTFPGERKVYHAFMVPRSAIGEDNIRSTGNKLGLREVNNGDFDLKNVEVPETFLLGNPNDKNTYGKLMDTLNISRIFVAAMAVGSAESSLEKAVDYVKGKREQFGQPIGEFQAVKFRIRQQQAKTLAAKLLTLNAARIADEEMKKHQSTSAEPVTSGDDEKKYQSKTELFETNASMAKLLASETAFENAYTLIRTMGGRGYLETPEGLGAPKLLRDAAVLPIYEGTSDIQRGIISKNILAKAKDRSTLTLLSHVARNKLLPTRVYDSAKSVDRIYENILSGLLVDIDTIRKNNGGRFKNQAEVFTLTLPLQRRMHLLADIATYREAMKLAIEQQGYWKQHPPTTDDDIKQNKLLKQFCLDAANAVGDLYTDYRSQSLKNLIDTAKDPLLV